MKALHLCLAVSALSQITSALPGSNSADSTGTNTGEPNPENPDSLGFGGSIITDPAKLAYLKALHQDTLDKLNHGEGIPVGSAHEVASALVNLHPHEKRFIPIIGIGGLVLIRTAGTISRSLEDIAGSLLSMFTGEDIIWEERGHCRHEIDTWAGWKGTFRTWNREAGSGNTMWEEKDVPWHDPTNPLSPPPVHMFNNQFLGDYSVQFTATDRGPWSGIPGTVECAMEGICNPQYMFYRKGYNIVLNTWQSQGVIADCQYKGNCGGMCQDEVKNQFSSGGAIWSSKCAVPCVEDGGDDFPSVPAENPRIMVAGDSISHGMQDDWTWRWRLYSWIKDVIGRDPQFVGPFQGTFGPLHPSAVRPQPPLLPGESPNPDASYRIPGWYENRIVSPFVDQGHAAWWGRQAAQTKNTIEGWVRDHQPDYLLVLLGFNDLGWFVSGPDDLVGNLGQLVNNARNAKPNIKILLGNVVHRTFINGRQDLVDNTNRFNTLLLERMTSWFRWESPLIYVDVNTNYQCRPHGGCPDAYDGLHPNAMGEFHIAQAFARTLQQHFGYVGPEFSVPNVAEVRIANLPLNVRAVSLSEGNYVTWDYVRGARAYDIRYRVQGATGWWSEGEVYPNSWAFWQTWLINGQTWEYQVRAKSLDDRAFASGWTPLVSATANIRTSPGPPNIAAVPSGGDGMYVSWAPVTGYSVNRYGVIIWDRDEPGSFVEERAATGTSLHISGLRAGHRYSVWVTTYVNLNSRIAGGLPGPGRDVFVGRGAPGVPGWVNVENIDPTTVRVTWPAVADASGYGIYIFKMDWTPHGEGVYTTETNFGFGFLFPGTWNYKYCVTAYNGNMESGRTARCYTPPVYPGFGKRDVVLQANGTLPTNFTDSRLIANGTISANVTEPYTTKTMLQDMDFKALLSKAMSQEIQIIAENTTAAVVDAVEALNFTVPTPPEEEAPQPEESLLQ